MWQASKGEGKKEKEKKESQASLILTESRNKRTQ